MKALYYQLVHGLIYRKHHNGVFLRCLDTQDSERVLHDFHDRPFRGHFTGNTKMHKVMQVGFYWPTLFKYALAYARKCPVCQRCANRKRRSAALL